MEKEKTTILLLVGLVALLSLSTWSLYTSNHWLYSSNQALESKLGDQQSQIETLEKYIQIFYKLFDSNYTPPVSKIEAVAKALSSDGWNSSSLNGMQVNASLAYVRFWVNNNGRGHGWEFLGEVSQPLNDYSPRFEYNTTNPGSNSNSLGTMTYRYVWSIVVQKSGMMSVPPPGLYYVDASTGELFKYTGLGFESVSKDQ
jgi:hypothetical protein